MINDIRFVNDSTGYAAGDSGTVFFTLFYGRWWRSIAPEPLFRHPGTTYSSIAFAGPRTVFILGDDRCYKQRIPEPMTGPRFRFRRSQRNTLSIEASPNPVSGNVHFEIASNSANNDGANPIVKVMDLTGRTMVDGIDCSNSGNNVWAASADLSQLSPGVYLAMVSLGGQTAKCDVVVQR